MLGLYAQRLVGSQRDGLPIFLARYWLTLHPFDSLIEDHHLPILRHVVEDCHALRADDHKALFLVRVQPTDEYVTANAPVEQQIRNSHVGDVWLQVCPASRAY